MSTGFHECRKKFVRKYGCPKSAFSVNFYTDRYPPIWVQFGEVALSVNCFAAPYSPIWIQFGEVNLDPCTFYYDDYDDYDDDDDDDWVKLNLENFEPLASILFCQST